MIRLADIQREVAETYGVSIEALKEPDGIGARDPSKVRPRQIGMYLARTRLLSKTWGEGRPMTLSHIGRFFGGRDHTTVRHAVISIAEERLKNKKLDMVLSGLERKLEAVDNFAAPSFLDFSGGA